MNQLYFNLVFVSAIAKIVEWHNEKEIKWFDGKNYITVEFPDNNHLKAIVRRHHVCGKIFWEDNYLNGLLHGKSICWLVDGQKCYEASCDNGNLVKSKYLLKRPTSNYWTA